METELANQPPQADDLLTVAARYVSDADAQCSDVSAMVFPSGLQMPTEEMLAVVSAKLRALIAGIEKIILSQEERQHSLEPVSWKLLSGSGFLKAPAIIDFALARFAEDRLNKRLAEHAEHDVAGQLPARMLSNGDAAVAEAAQAILASESLMRHSPEQLYRELPAELLHQLCWHLVAALQIEAGEKNVAHVAAAKSLLQNHDESQTGRIAARKLVHFLSEDAQAEALKPERAGLNVFTASLSARTGLEHDHILRLIDGHSCMPLATLLRASNIGQEAAMAIICLFKGFELTPFEITVFENQYGILEPEAALHAIACWGNARMQFLAFPGLQTGKQK